MQDHQDAVEHLLKVEVRAEKAEAERDDYAQSWAEVEEALHDYWFSQKSMSAGDAVRQLLAENQRLREGLNLAIEIQNDRVDEIQRLREALRDIEASGHVGPNALSREAFIARRALGEGS